MKPYLFYPPFHTDALAAAQRQLERLGYDFVDHPSPEITHLLLPVPAASAGLDVQLAMLPPHIHILGGRLAPLKLEHYTTTDLLEDARYLAKNAAITAHCAVKLAAGKLPCTWEQRPVLVIGWGRIGKCLAQLLQALGAQVTVAARKEADRAMLEALGYRAADPACLSCSQYRVIYNTAPAQAVPPQALAQCPGNCLKIELASTSGLTGSDVLIARGLPGSLAPESSGSLIAETVHRLLLEGRL